MALLPARNILDGTALPVTSQMKTALGILRDYLAALLGTDSADPAAARAALGVTNPGMKNKLINGAFSVNQRGYVSGAAVGANLYGHDRWKMAASADTYSYTTTAGKTTITVPAGKVLRQVIEGLSLQSGTYVLSWEGTAQGKIGAGGLGASGVTGAIIGGTDTAIEFAPGTVANVQLELATVATAFEHRPYGLERRLCERYYRLAQFSTGVFTSATTAVLGIPHSGMRAAPTPAINSAATVSNGSTNFGQSSANIGTFSNTSDAGAYQLANFTGAIAATPALLTVGTISFNSEL